MRPISDELRPLARNRHSKPVERNACHWSNRNFTVTVAKGSGPAWSGVRLCKSNELLRNISGQNVRIESSKLADGILAVEGWVAEFGEVNSGANGGVAVVTNEQDHDTGTQRACGLSQDKVITRSSVEEVWEGADEGYAVVC
jgi:hypothetical protein